MEAVYAVLFLGRAVACVHASAELMGSRGNALRKDLPMGVLLSLSSSFSSAQLDATLHGALLCFRLMTAVYKSQASKEHTGSADIFTARQVLSS